LILSAPKISGITRTDQDRAKRDEAAVVPAKRREGIWLETWILAWQGKMIADGLRWWERLFDYIQHCWMYDAASFW
jgi:hypothetical protein